MWVFVHIFCVSLSALLNKAIRHWVLMNFRAAKAAAMILNLTGADNGASLTV